MNWRRGHLELGRKERKGSVQREAAKDREGHRDAPGVEVLGRPGTGVGGGEQGKKSEKE